MIPDINGDTFLNRNTTTLDIHLAYSVTRLKNPYMC